MVSVHPQIECNLCGQSSFTVLEDGQQPHRVLKCDICSLVFVYPHPDPTGLKDHYDMAYYQEWLNSQKRQRLRMWQKRLKKIKKNRSGKKLLDIGCGEGSFLDLARQGGWTISGTEASAYASNYASEGLKTDIYNGDLLSAAYAENSFDLVTMWHVLEHVDDPKKYLSEIRRILKPDGLFVLAVPNVNNLVFQIAYRIVRGRRLKLFTIGEKEIHLYHFSPATLRDFLKKAGFTCLRLAPDYGIIEPTKKMLNFISVVPYYLAGVHIYDAMEVFASPNK